MKSYRYVRGLEGSPEGTVRELSEQDAAPLVKSGAIVEDDATGEPVLDDQTLAIRTLVDDAVSVRDAAIIQRDDALTARDAAIVERDSARRDLESANTLLADTSTIDQLRNDLEVALKRGDRAEADLLKLKSPPAEGNEQADGNAPPKPGKPAK